MIELETAVVEEIKSSRKGIQQLAVSSNGPTGKKTEKAVNYVFLSGEAFPGDRVLLNSGAEKLKLGSGGYHYVVCNLNGQRMQLSGGREKGHIMKLRYTPMQVRVHSWEEKLNEKNVNAALSGQMKLKGMPVALAELHSMLTPYALALKKINNGRKIAYIMTDSAALPHYLSETAHRLKKDGILLGTVTGGQAFGGDLETVNQYTALLAAREELGADAAIMAPGPGAVGTSTALGFSSIEAGDNVDIVNKLGGLPVFIPRLSFAERRKRHFGLSHHSLTILQEIALTEAFLPLPLLGKNKMAILLRQLHEKGIIKKHRVKVLDVTRAYDYIVSSGYDLRVMGKTPGEDPAYFAGTAAAACLTESLLS